MDTSKDIVKALAKWKAFQENKKKNPHLYVSGPFNVCATWHAAEDLFTAIEPALSWIPGIGAEIIGVFNGVSAVMDAFCPTVKS